MLDKEQPNFNQLGYLLAESSSSVVFVVGAGASRSSGLPLWTELQAALKERARDYIAKRSTGPGDKDAALSKLDKIQDPWNLGDYLEEVIPQEAYDREVRRLLTPQRESAIYDRIWSLNPSGMISLNLDCLAKGSLKGTPDQVATARDVAQYQRFLLLSRPFLLQAHGDLDVKGSWVLSGRKRNQLLKSDSYKQFIRNLLACRRLVLVGLQPQDIAFQQVLVEDFRGDLTRGVDHFWFCPDPGPDERLWAESFNVSIIGYSPSSADHPEIPEALGALGRFRPREPHAGAAYSGETIERDDLPSDGELRVLTVEDIRRRLNAAVKGLEERFHDSDYEKELRRLFLDFSGSLRMAWHVQPDSQYETLWGTRIKKRIGGGAFGGVWEAEDAVDGTRIAVKILHEEVLHEKEFLEAFRRGVRAMRILSETNVPGMVRFVRAYDVPACVFMEHIEGMNFEEAIESGVIDNAASAVWVVLRTAEIVLSGHELDRQVLHRDLKPSNVMIRNLFDDSRQYEVVVLDFDLSWYEGAIGKSMVSSSLNNYIAPEQLSSNRSGFSSRHSAVDVFGCGMLLYFAMAGVAPVLNAQERAAFYGDLVATIARRWKEVPKGVATFAALVVEDATYSAQDRRCSLPTLIDRLRSMHEVLDRGDVELGSVIANIIVAARLEEYGWKVNYDINRLHCIEMRQQSSLLTLYIGQDFEVEAFCVELQHSPTEEAPRGAQLKKYIGPKLDAAEASLKRDGLLEVNKTVFTGGASSLRGRKGRAVLRVEEILETADVIGTAAGKLIFA